MNGTSQRYRATALKDVLRQQGRMQRWLAARVGISEALMSYIIASERTASAEVAEKIASTLNMPLFLLFESTSAYETSLDEEAVPA